MIKIKKRSAAALRFLLDNVRLSGGQKTFIKSFFSLPSLLTSVTIRTSWEGTMWQ